jgi:hypothetical protein
MCHHRPQPPGRQVLQHLRLDLHVRRLDLVNTVTPYVHLYLSMTLGVSHPWSVTPLLRSLSPSSGIRPSPLPHRHEPAWPSPSSSTTIFELHTCAPQAKRHVAQHQLTPWLVQQLNPD